MADPQEVRGYTQQIPGGAPVPAARPLDDFAYEQIGDDLIIFDAETMQYHTLNGMAYQIWSKCVGRASAAAIAADLGLTVEVVQETVNDLGVASLLQSSSESWPTSMTRRRATKYITAGVVGAIGAPIVLSMTAPSHQAAATHDDDCPFTEILSAACGTTYAAGFHCVFYTPNFSTPIVCCPGTGGWLIGNTCPVIQNSELTQVDLEYESVGFADVDDEVQIVESEDSAPPQAQSVEQVPANVQVVEEVPAEVQYVPEVQAQPQVVEVVEAPAQVSADVDAAVEQSGPAPNEEPTE